MEITSILFLSENGLNNFHFFSFNLITMKYLSVILSLSSILIFSVQVQAQNDQQTLLVKPESSVIETFSVYGNCGMCKRRIAGAVTKLEGVESASWDSETKLITVKFDDSILSLDDIQKKIAEVGHDTDKYRAKDEVYQKLPGCCLYDRPKS